MIRIRIELGNQKIRGKQSVRTTRSGISYIPKETRDFQKLLLMNYYEQYPKRLRPFYEIEPLRICVDCLFRMPNSWSKKKKVEMKGMSMTGKPDCSNILKLIEDTFEDGLMRRVMGGLYQGAIYKNDSQISSVSVNKTWGDVNVLEITIIPTEM